MSGYSINDCIIIQVMHDNYDRIKEIIKEDPTKVNCVDYAGYTPLYYAHTYEIAKLLIDNGADVNVVFNDRSKNTLLHKCTSPEVYELLIKSGANINALNDGYYKETPLEYIVTKINSVNYCNSLKLVKLLILYGVNIDIIIDHEKMIQYINKKSSYDDPDYSIMKEIMVLMLSIKPDIASYEIQLYDGPMIFVDYLKIKYNITADDFTADYVKKFACQRRFHALVARAIFRKKLLE